MRQSELSCSEGEKMNYREYLKSPEWKATKIRYLKSKLPKECGVCGAAWSNAMQFHHKTYKRLGREKLMDIVPVCDPCHLRVHALHEERNRRDLWGCLKGAKRRFERENRKSNRANAS
jgi:hypothetical protein